MMATLASYEGMFGPYHPQTLALATSLALALYASDRPEEGRRLLERAIVDLTKHHGKHHPVRIRALEAWSALLREQGNWMAALPVQRELLECRTHLLGQDHPESVAARQHLSACHAVILGSIGDLPGRLF
jgi:eukaryotic-like serine/threonine-protein kinase